MFTHNRTEFVVGGDAKWEALCRALIRRSNILITEAGSTVPIIDIRYEDWRSGSDHEILKLIRTL